MKFRCIDVVFALSVIAILCLCLAMCLCVWSVCVTCDWNAVHKTNEYWLQKLQTHKRNLHRTWSKLLKMLQSVFISIPYFIWLLMHIFIPYMAIYCELETKLILIEVLQSFRKLVRFWCIISYRIESISMDVVSRLVTISYALPLTQNCMHHMHCKRWWLNLFDAWNTFAKGNLIFDTHTLTPVCS